VSDDGWIDLYNIGSNGGSNAHNPQYNIIMFKRVVQIHKVTLKHFLHHSSAWYYLRGGNIEMTRLLDIRRHDFGLLEMLINLQEVRSFLWLQALFTNKTIV